MVAIESKDDLYIINLLEDFDEFYQMLEQYAKENHVPIIDKIGIRFLLQLLKIKQAKNVLEIGTAIGYTALKLAETIGCKVTTLERDDKMYEIATNNVMERGLSEKINLIHVDALKLHSKVIANAPYDIVFIDGAKSQNRKFFELYEPYFTDDVVVITDNVLFKGMVANSDIIEHSKNLKQLLKKINNYNEWLLKHEQYDSVILPIGDGITITTKKNKKL